MTSDINFQLANAFKHYFLFLLYKSKTNNQKVIFDNSCYLIEGLENNEIEVAFVHGVAQDGDTYSCIISFKNIQPNFYLKFKEKDLTKFLEIK